MKIENTTENKIEQVEKSTESTERKILSTRNDKVSRIE